MHQANLTRLGPLRLEGDAQRPAHRQENFKALAGPAELVLKGPGIGSADLSLNGQRLAVGGTPASDSTSLTIQLDAVNSLELTVTEALELRIRQHAEADLGIVCQGYFGLNSSDIERQRAFYKMLGFRGEIYPAGPETSTSFARSLGFEDDYLIYVSLHSLQDPPTMPFVDTVQFRGDSYRDEAPYARLNHLGMTYASYATADLDGAYTFLRSQGVEFLSAPAVAPDGERFCFFKEPDGAFWKLLQAEVGDTGGTPPQLVRLVNTNMNVSDLERSREFYRLLGFSQSAPGAMSGSGDFAAAHGFEGTIAFDGEDVSLGEDTDGATLQLRRWLNPFDGDAPYAPPVNHLGIDRINFYVKDLSKVIATMNALGFEQLGPIGGGPEIGIVFFFDPDGIKVQFAGPVSS